MTTPRSYGFPAFTAADIDTVGTPREREMLEHIRSLEAANEKQAEVLRVSEHAKQRLEAVNNMRIDEEKRWHETEGAICEALNKIARHNRTPIGVGGAAMLCVIRDIDQAIKSLEAQRDARWPAVPMGEGTPAVSIERTSNGVYVAQRFPDAASVINDHMATGNTEAAALEALEAKIRGRP